MTQTYEVPEIIRLAGEGIWELDDIRAVEDGIEFSIIAEAEVCVDSKTGERKGEDYAVQHFHVKNSMIEKICKALTEVRRRRPYDGFGDAG
ncbi:MAG: hypothetical protein F4145_16705 [Boseongicola sp. SB0675_bin_26]|nr:hypothetical protein [Boseongicola sp. SB0675_bin_26]